MRRGQNNFARTIITICCKLNYNVHTINLIKVLSLVSDPLTNIIIIVLEILKDVFVFYSPNITRITQFCGGHKASLNLQRKYGICCGQTPTQMKRLNFFLLK